MYAHCTDELNVIDELEEASVQDEDGDSISSEEDEVIELKLKESADSSSDDGSSSDHSSSSEDAQQFIIINGLNEILDVMRMIL